MVLSPHGEHAEVFLPEPQTEFINGLPSNEREKGVRLKQSKQGSAS